jgi:hypothetical protein
MVCIRKSPRSFAVILLGFLPPLLLAGVGKIRRETKDSEGGKDCGRTCCDSWGGGGGGREVGAK